jgi:hypothetical protein
VDGGKKQSPPAGNSAAVGERHSRVGTGIVRLWPFTAGGLGS